MPALAIGLRAQSTTTLDETFQARIPMGTDALQLGKSGNTLYLLAMAESEQFEGWHHVRSNGQPTLTDTSGSQVTTYPDIVRFRVTASTWKDMLNTPPFPYQDVSDVNNFLLKLRFQVRLFRGLKQSVLRPDSVQLIGVPEEVPSNERIYEVTFAFHNIPVTERCQLEVYSPSGERLSRFHLDLY